MDQQPLTQQLQLDWQEIETVFLDMDGTLLDLYFDNHFWLEHIPKRLAEKQAQPLEQAREQLMSLYHSKRGTLDWYCIDYWSAQLGLDILALKSEVEHLIRFHPHVEEFLHWLRESGREVALVTNAHPGTLNFKLERIPLAHYFSHLISSHHFGYPKESQEFWQRLMTHLPFNPQHTLFIDDSESVLQAARDFGIGHVIAISHPDSQAEGKNFEDFVAISNFAELAR